MKATVGSPRILMPVGVTVLLLDVYVQAKSTYYGNSNLQTVFVKNKGRFDLLDLRSCIIF
jgi:hypothetical protein